MESPTDSEPACPVAEKGFAAEPGFVDEYNNPAFSFEGAPVRSAEGWSPGQSLLESGARTPELPGYGSVLGPLLTPTKLAKMARGRLAVDWTSLFQGMAVPWLLFIAVYSLASFRSIWAPVVLALVGLLVLRLAYLTFDAWRCRYERNGLVLFSVTAFYLLTCLVALLVGNVMGQRNAALLAPYDTLTAMSIYYDVEPDDPMAARQVIDAGRLVFAPGSRLDLTRSEGLRHGEMFCVAPVTSGHLVAGATANFWAVGKGCCSGSRPDFACGPDYANPKAYAGTRLLDDASRPFYRLAVQQAEAAHKIKAPEPIFITWTQDPVADIAARPKERDSRFVVVAFTSLAVQAFLTAAAAAVLAKLQVLRA